jgi:hypothetical protein
MHRAVSAVAVKQPTGNNKTEQRSESVSGNARYLSCAATGSPEHGEVGETMRTEPHDSHSAAHITRALGLQTDTNLKERNRLEHVGKEGG